MLQTGALHKIDGIKRKEDYVGILKQHLKTSAKKLKLGSKWVQIKKKPHHPAKEVPERLKDDRSQCSCVAITHL